MGVKVASAVSQANDSVRLMEALERVQAIDADTWNRGKDEAPRIQVWKGDELLGPALDLPAERPSPAPTEQTFNDRGVEYRAHIVEDSTTNMAVRIVMRRQTVVSVVWPSVGFVFVPLLLSLPLLLVPAWLTVRSGLRPLRDLAEEVNLRVSAASLDPLTVSTYRELDSLVASFNRLMTRLRDQLTRERAFVAEVAHQMKTPLAIMQANLDLARRSTSEAQREVAMRDLDKGIARADRLIRQLLRLARMEHEDDGLTNRRFDLAEFLRERLGFRRRIRRFTSRSHWPSLIRVTRIGRVGP